MRSKYWLVAGIALSFASALGLLAQQNTPVPKAPMRFAAKEHDVSARSEGQRVFEQNCSRCHNAPDGFSPRISGTVVRHMRVRASLSQHDEQVLLKFFNP